MYYTLLYVQPSICLYYKNVLSYQVLSVQEFQSLNLELWTVVLLCIFSLYRALQYTVLYIKQ